VSFLAFSIFNSSIQNVCFGLKSYFKKIINGKKLIILNTSITVLNKPISLLDLVGFFFKENLFLKVPCHFEYVSWYLKNLGFGGMPCGILIPVLISRCSMTFRSLWVLRRRCLDGMCLWVVGYTMYQRQDVCYTRTERHPPSTSLSDSHKGPDKKL